jgi:hypothetical protein
MQKRGETEVRDIRHLQFTAWPDHGVPDHPTPFLMFLKRVKSLNPPEAGPIITHCRYGYALLKQIVNVLFAALALAALAPSLQLIIC